MAALITRGIRVSAEAMYQPEHSKPTEFRFVFAYRIIIENLSEDTVQLLRRHWIIYNANTVIREVEGEGIVGEQPVLIPGQMHQYVSWCQLVTDMGKMWGTYQMIIPRTGEEFEVAIPEFHLVTPMKLN